MNPSSPSTPSLVSASDEPGRLDAGTKTSRQSMPSVYLLLAVVLAVLPLASAGFTNAWGHSYSRLFPLALLGAAWFVWRLRLQSISSTSVISAWTTSALAIGIVLLALASVIWLPWLALLVWAILSCAIVGWAGGEALLKATVPAVMAVAVFQPMSDRALATLGWLGQTAMSGASRLLYAAEIPHLSRFGAIDLPKHEVSAGVAVNALAAGVAVVAGVVLILGWRRRKWWQIGICVLFGLLLVFPVTIVRTFGVIWALHQKNWNLTDGWGAAGMDLLASALVIGVVLSFEQVVLFFSDPLNRPERGARPPASPEPVLMVRRLPQWSVAIFVICVLLAVVQLIVGWMKGAWTSTDESNAAPSTNQSAPAVITLPVTEGATTNLSLSTQSTN